MNPKLSAAAWLRTLLPMLLAAFAGPAAALPEDMLQAIDIEAEYVEIDAANSTSTYRGNVTLSRGSIKITADEIIVRQRNDKGHVSATMRGKPATYQQVRQRGEAPLEAQASEIIYASDTEIVEMRDNARILRGADKVSSERIRYNMREDRIIAGNGSQSGRVKITIQPQTIDQAGEQ